LSLQPRPLPDRLSLRYLKLEAKRRLATREFATLHQAQLAIAREHGLSSWTGLKELIEAAGHASHAMAQVRWVMSRFAAADTAEWTAPDEEELRQHFEQPQTWRCSMPASESCRPRVEREANLRDRP
jgi:hypothetical protein